MYTASFACGLSNGTRLLKPTPQNRRCGCGKRLMPPRYMKFERHPAGEGMLKLNTMSTYLRHVAGQYTTVRVAGSGASPAMCPDCSNTYIPGTRCRRETRPPTCRSGTRPSTPPLHWVTGNSKKRRYGSQLALFLPGACRLQTLQGCAKCDFKDGVITYRRQKTGRQTTWLTSPPKRQAAYPPMRQIPPHGLALLNILGDENCRFPLGRREESTFTQQVLRSSTGSSNCWRQPHSD